VIRGPRVTRSDGQGLGTVTMVRCAGAVQQDERSKDSERNYQKKITTLILKGCGPRRGALRLGGPLAPIADEPYKLGAVIPD